MLCWNDLETDEKIKIYNNGIVIEENGKDVYNPMINCRYGNIWSPNLEQN